MRAPLYSSVNDELLQAESIANPHVLYSRLRNRMPLSRVADSGVHILANWDLIHEALEREGDFSANLTGVLCRAENGEPVTFELPQSGGTSVIATADNPRHAVHRRVLQARFTPTAIGTLESAVHQWVKDQFQPLLDAGGGDAVPACERVPALVVARLLGLPETDVDYFRVWAMMGGDILAGEVTVEGLQFLSTETARMSEYLGEHFDLAFQQAEVQECAGEPLLHTLARGVRSGDINRTEALGIAVVLFGAGGESTAALLSSCLKWLAESPELCGQLREDLDLVPRFVEEVVRLEPPFKFHYRSVRHACTLAGYDLQEGDRLMLLWAAANRDPKYIEYADELRLDRKHPKQHVGFGRGLHFCIGAVLARLEARVMLRHLLEQGVELRAQPSEAVYANSIFVRRLEKLQLNISVS